MIDALAILAAIALGFGAFWGSETLRTRSRVRRRMKPFADVLGIEGDGGGAVAAKSDSRRTEGQTNALFARMQARYPLSGGTRTSIIAVIAALLSSAALTPFLVFVGMAPALAVPTGIILGTALGWNVGTMLESRQREAFSDRFLLALEDLQRMVRYGIPTTRALHSVADAAQPPLKESLRNILLEASFGVPLERAIGHEGRRVGMSELAMLAAIVSTQSSTGGNLSEAVGNLAAMSRERMDGRVKMKASTAESRMTLIILSAVPVLGVGMQAVMQPDIISVLLNEGRHLLGIGIAFMAAGLIVAWLMIRSAQR